MDETARINRRRNMTIFANNRDAPSTKPRFAPTYEIYNALVVGAVETGLEESVITYSFQTEILNAAEAVLQYAATANLGPTRSSRFFYLWFATIAQAYSWVTNGRYSGVVDGWDWTRHNKLFEVQDISTWMTQVLIEIMPSFVASYDCGAVLRREREQTGWSITDQGLAIDRVKAAGNWSSWNVMWGLWLSNRTSDGSVAAAVAPTAADLPNGATNLEVSGSQDPATFTEPTKWTPLKIGAAIQKYLTYNWRSVTAAVITPAQQTTIDAAAATYFPSTADRLTEIGEVISITDALTDTQKVIAEFWAGGPGTVSPPGMFIWFWKTYMRATRMYQTDIDKFIYSGFDLAVHLFETGRIVWGLKKSYMQARPIQEVRRLYHATAMKKYDGTNIVGSAWVPYQETNFVTPPFADFPSGHSAFSRSFANVMNDWFGGSVPATDPIELTDLVLLSPVLTGSQTQQLMTFDWPALQSGIQPGVVPAATVRLSWTSWNDMAESAGISRKYGGIHATSAHTGSVAAADALHTAIRTVLI
jgi:membrane-associated phospholipid phosphatase